MKEQDAYAAFMLDHAAGNHSAAFAVAGDLHVMLSRDGAETAHIWSVIGGVLLETDCPDVPHGSQRGSGWKRGQQQANAASRVAEIGQDTLRWRRSVFGPEIARIGISGAKLMRMEPGKSTPRHGHRDLEVTVVLEGEFSDGHGIYKRGDLVIGEPGMVHKPQAVGDRPCVCYVAEARRLNWRPA